MGPSIFREKTAMRAGTAAKGPMSSDMTKELTNQKVSASLPVAWATTGAADHFSLESVFFMADLLSRMSWGGAESFRTPLCSYTYARGMPRKRREGCREQARRFFSRKNKELHP
jgi:hypothetical protein